MQGSGLAGTTNLALLAPVRDGLAPGFEPVSYLERLRRLLDAMHASRRNARESELRGSVFPDPIGRFGIISQFRYALVPPGLVGSGRWHLSLNVSFDGGWEPYMRVIYRDIGALLDALLCHCEGYPGSRTSDFGRYCRWVRSAELDAGIFYTDSAATLADQHYLASVERLQRESGDPLAADRAIAAHAEPDLDSALAAGLSRALRDPAQHLPLQLRTLKGLYRLTGFWGGADGEILLRFAQLVLGDFSAAIKDPALAAAADWQQVSFLFADELAWLAQPLSRLEHEKRLDWDPALLQAPLQPGDSGATHGALVLLRVTDADAAAAHLANLAPRCAAPAAAEGEARAHVAFTPAGLRALKIHPERLDRLPPEFHDGMERRAGLLGDLRGNHPDHWHRPLRHGVDAVHEDRIELGAVHVAVMLRFIDAAEPGHALHPRLKDEVTALGSLGTGLAVLAVEATRSRTVGPNGRDHFGFADGISQPLVVTGTVPDQRKHQVRPGELVLGFANDRGDGPTPVLKDDLLDRGSFLVVRKLRQRLDHLGAALNGAVGSDKGLRTDLLERMVGRRQDGTPLVAAGPGGNNDFDFRGSDGLQCPFASHVRRTNPRDGRQAMPRILRRGMGYGPAANEEGADADRGVLFMAYCASIAEQFETVQRWVAGGNSSGVGSAQSDPLLGVPRDGEKRVFRWVDEKGEPACADLGDKAFVELQWGLYLFVPALAALTRLRDFRTAPAPLPETLPPAPAPLDRWRGRLEDRDNGRTTWQEVRKSFGGVRDVVSYGHLVGKADAVFDALADDQAARVSVRGFGDRMRTSIGINHLGMDPAGGHKAVGDAVNPVVAGVGEEEAFSAAWRIADAVLAGFIGVARSPYVPRHPDGRLRVPVDLVALSERVVGALARLWFGLPDDKHMKAGGRLPPPLGDAVPRCPGHIIGPSRMIFGAHPRDDVVREGQLNGPLVLEAVKAALADGLPAGTGTLTAKLRAPLAALARDHGADLLEREVAGLLLGFAPTVQGNFLRVMKDWIEGGSLWALQQELAERLQARDEPWKAALATLRRRVLDTMQAAPVPATVWRCPVLQGQPDPSAPPVVLGLASAIEGLDPVAGQAQRDALLFGGDYFAAKASGRWGLHACPGSKMGLGVMAALAARLLAAGTLRATGSPVLLMLTPRQ